MKITITKMMYGWSKWGGGRHGLVKENLEEWYCQNCAELQKKDLPSYMVETSEREFVRVCSKCKHQMVQKRLRDFWSLLDYTRKSAVCKPDNK